MQASRPWIRRDGPEQDRAPDAAPPAWARPPGRTAVTSYRHEAADRFTAVSLVKRLPAKPENLASESAPSLAVHALLGPLRAGRRRMSAHGREFGESGPIAQQRSVAPVSNTVAGQRGCEAGSLRARNHHGSTRKAQWLMPVSWPEPCISSSESPYLCAARQPLRRRRSAQARSRSASRNPSSDPDNAWWRFRQRSAQTSARAPLQSESAT